MTTGPEPFFRYWGKARPIDGGPAYHLLPFHALDVAATGHVFLSRQPRLMAWWRQRLGIDGESLLQWVTFWLALHDLGKFSLSFQAQRTDLVEELQGLPEHAGSPDVRHDSLGWHLWSERLAPIAEREEWFGTDRAACVYLGSWVRAVTGHHGQPPIEQRAPLYQHFRPQDEEAALCFARAAKSLLLSDAAARLPEQLGDERFEHVSRDLSWWMAGLAVLADWIGSNAAIFRYRAVEQPLGSYWPEALVMAEDALNRCGVLPVPQRPCVPFDLLFPHIRQASPLQSWAADVTLPAGPQLHLLEDVTGAGKTEAAVMLTHRLLASGHADGFFIGLPTMATANAMYERIANVYEKLFAGQPSLVLTHGKKDLVEAFAASVIDSGEDESDPLQADDSATRRCLRWLADHQKRALLAPAGVGTIDQALLAVLSSKHQSLRLLGLVGKVLVVDEVHACDEYMQRTLETLLEFHARAGGSAVLLSATLTGRMKGKLLSAFAKGCGQRARLPAGNKPYPLATSWAAATPTTVLEQAIATRPEVRRSLQIRYECDVERLMDDIVAALEADQCVGWIRNTIGDAMDAHEALSHRVPAERITLFHARFALGDRLDIEGRVLDLFGPNSGPGKRRGRLLIATQVAEQSLDLDLDVLVSDLAPIDRIIQRAGRLRRHVRDAQGRRRQDGGTADERGEPCLWVLGPPWSPAPAADWFSRAFPKVVKVYANHGQLWRTAQVLQAGRLTMPGDARTVIEDVFGEDAEWPEALARNATDAEGQGHASRSMADANRIKFDAGYCRAGFSDWMDDKQASSRLGEETVEVLIGRWHGGVLEPWRSHRDPRHAWAYSSVRLAARLISAAPEEATAERQGARAAALSMLPGGGKWVIVLGFEQVDGVWRAQGLLSARDGSVRSAVWRYDPSSGLMREQAHEPAAPTEVPISGR